MKKFLQNNSTIVLASIVTGIGNWAFKDIMLGHASAEAISIFNSFLSFLLITTSLSNWLTLLATRLGNSSLDLLKEKFVQKRKFWIFLCIIIISIIMLILSYQKYPVFLYFYFLVVFCLSLLIAFFKGVLQFQNKFLKLAILSIFEAIGKLALLGIMLPFFSDTYFPYFLALLIEIIASLIFLKFTNNKTNETESKDFSFKSESINSLFYSVGLMIFLYLDQFYGGTKLSNDEYVDYIAILQIVNIVLFQITALLNVLLPTIQKTEKIIQKLKLALLSSFLFFAGTVFSGTVVTLFYTPISTRLKIEIVDISLIYTMLLAVFFLGLGLVLQNLLIDLKSKWYISIPIVSSIFQIVLFQFFANSLLHFVNIYLCSSLLILFMGLVLLFKKLKYEK